MIGIENKDQSFFQIESPDIDLSDYQLSRNLISLSISEKKGRLPQGTLKFLDQNHAISRILRTGARLKLAWGYKSRTVTPDSLLSQSLNTDEVTGNIQRRGLEVQVNSPTGSADQNGQIIYNLNFFALGMRGDKTARKWTEGTKADVIGTLFDELGILPTNRIIDFSVGKDSLNINQGVRQDVSNFLFLSQLALEWRALFHIQYNQSGSLTAIFVDQNKIGDPRYSSLFYGAVGSSNIIGYKGALNNVISYSWDSAESQSGVGDNVKIEIIDGQITFRRFVADQQKTVTYRLNQDRIKEIYENTDNIQESIKITKELLSVNDFEQVKRFFDPIESSTAPFGFGYTINAKMIGNPLLGPPNKIIINNGFPDVLGNSGAFWYIQTATHNISKAGYFTDLEIIDVFTLSPIGQPVL